MDQLGGAVSKGPEDHAREFGEPALIILVLATVSQMGAVQEAEGAGQAGSTQTMAVPEVIMNSGW